MPDAGEGRERKGRQTDRQCGDAGLGGEVGTWEGEGEREREREGREPLTPTDGRRARVVESARPSVRPSVVRPSLSPSVGPREKGTKDKAANLMDDRRIYLQTTKIPPLHSTLSFSLRLRFEKVPDNSVIWNLGSRGTDWILSVCGGAKAK